MRLIFKKSSAGVTLTCMRADGTVAVQRSRHGAFFAVHDLLHYAVETTLGLRRAFLGLMAEGWEFENFTRHDDPKYRRLPAEALLAEQFVALLSARLGDLQAPDPDVHALLAEEVSAELIAEAARGGTSVRALTPTDVAEIGRVFAALLRRWNELPEGEQMGLEFPRHGESGE